MSKIPDLFKLFVKMRINKLLLGIRNDEYSMLGVTGDKRKQKSIKAAKKILSILKKNGAGEDAIDYVETELENYRNDDFSYTPFNLIDDLITHYFKVETNEKNTISGKIVDGLSSAPEKSVRTLGSAGKFILKKAAGFGVGMLTGSDNLVRKTENIISDTLSGTKSQKSSEKSSGGTRASSVKSGYQADTFNRIISGVPNSYQQLPGYNPQERTNFFQTNSLIYLRKISEDVFALLQETTEFHKLFPTLVAAAISSPGKLLQNNKKSAKKILGVEKGELDIIANRAETLSFTMPELVHKGDDGAGGESNFDGLIAIISTTGDKTNNLLEGGFDKVETVLLRIEKLLQHPDGFARYNISGGPTPGPGFMARQKPLPKSLYKEGQAPPQHSPNKDDDTTILGGILGGKKGFGKKMIGGALKFGMSRAAIAPLAGLAIGATGLAIGNWLKNRINKTEINKKEAAISVLEQIDELDKENKNNGINPDKKPIPESITTGSKVNDWGKAIVSQPTPREGRIISSSREIVESFRKGEISLEEAKKRVEENYTSRYRVDAPQTNNQSTSQVPTEVVTPTPSSSMVGPNTISSTTANYTNPSQNSYRNTENSNTLRNNVINNNNNVVNPTTVVDMGPILEALERLIYTVEEGQNSTKIFTT